MKKQELRAMKPLYATQKMMELVREDTGTQKETLHTYAPSVKYMEYKYNLYYRAVIENNILKVAVFTRKQMAAGEQMPQYEIYLSKEENTHLTYAVREEKWRTGKINTLNYDTGRLPYGTSAKKPWVSETDKKKINEYLGTGNKEAKEAILTFQREVAKDRLTKKYKSELEGIDAVMDVVPELPKDFDKWILDQGFINERYLIYQYGDKNHSALCTHCGKTVHLKERPKHNQMTVCPACKSEAWMKAWKKQKYLSDKKKIGIIQNLTDGSGYILRLFDCKLKRKQENGYRLDFAGCWERRRFKLDNHFVPIEYFEWGEYKNTGVTRWCHELNHGMYYWHYQDGECVLYTRNLKRLRKGTELQYVPVEVLFRHNPGCYCDPTDMLRNMLRYPQMEYLIKAGLYRLAWELAAGRGREVVDWNKKKLWEAMKVTKEQLHFCIKINIGARGLEVLQIANEYRVSLTERQLQFFEIEIGPGLVGNIFQYGHIEKFYKYLVTLIQNKEKCGDYIDYLEDMEYLQIPPTEDVLFPKNFQQTHQRLALQRREKEDAVRKMEIAEKDKLLQAMFPELEEIYQFEDGQFCIVLPTCKEDFNREGRENHNCVGGSYYDKMLKGQSCVMFLRRKEEPGKAFCTVEMNREKILQCRAVCNSEPPEEAKAFMEKFSKEVARRIRKQKNRMQITA